MCSAAWSAAPCHMPSLVTLQAATQDLLASSLSAVTALAELPMLLRATQQCGIQSTFGTSSPSITDTVSLYQLLQHLLCAASWRHSAPVQQQRSGEGQLLLQSTAGSGSRHRGIMVGELRLSYDTHCISSHVEPTACTPAPLHNAIYLLTALVACACLQEGPSDSAFVLAFLLGHTAAAAAAAAAVYLLRQVLEARTTA
jgi:hypothetical protein